MKSNFHKFYGNVRLGDQFPIGFVPMKEANENIWKLRLNQNSVNVRMVWGPIATSCGAGSEDSGREHPVI
jgi:hypothetical protein